MIKVLNYPNYSALQTEPSIISLRPFKVQTLKIRTNIISAFENKCVPKCFLSLLSPFSDPLDSLLLSLFSGYVNTENKESAHWAISCCLSNLRLKPHVGSEYRKTLLPRNRICQFLPVKFTHIM